MSQIDTLGDVTFKDINYDGKEDMIISKGSYGALDMTFVDILLWDEMKQTFVKTSHPYLTSVANIEFDDQTRTITFAKQTCQTSWNYYKYQINENNEFQFIETVQEYCVRHITIGRLYEISEKELEAIPFECEFKISNTKEGKQKAYEFDEDRDRQVYALSDLSQAWQSYIKGADHPKIFKEKASITRRFSNATTHYISTALKRWKSGKAITMPWVRPKAQQPFNAPVPFFTRAPPCVTLRRGLRHRAGKEGCMTVYLDPGKERFLCALNDEIYLDKSGIIGLINRTLSTPEGYICMTKPRRFGKTVTANMLAAYYDCSCDSHDIFDTLEIAKHPSYEKHLNHYNVIQVDVQGMRDRVGKEDFEHKFSQEILKDMHEKWPDIVTGTEPNLFTAFHHVYEHTKVKFVFIFDEWDCIARNDKNDLVLQKNWITFLRMLFKDGPAEKYTALVYLTGILPIRKYGSQSSLGHFKEYTIVAPLRFSPWVGFTESDVEILAKQFDMNFDEMKYWYDGYLVRGKHVYNPSSVVTACINGECNMFWTKTESFESLRHLISANFDHLKECIIRMLNGEFVHVDVISFNNTLYDLACADDVITLLIHIGYLGYDSETENAFIPNEEVRRLFKTAVKDCGWTEVDRAIQLSNQFMFSLLAMDGDSVAQILEQIHAECCSVLKYNDENSLSCAIGFAAYTARKDYTLIREMPSGRGFTDIVMLPRPNRNKPGILIELKWNQKAESAIDQIYKKNYPRGLDAYKDNLILVAVTYNKAGDNTHTCKIMKYVEE